MSNQKALLLILILVLFYHAMIAAVYLFENNLIFMPKDLPAKHEFRCNFSCEEYKFLSPQTKQTLSIIHLQPRDSVRAQFIYFHGNSRNLQGWIPEVESLVDMGIELLLVDYPGYGKSTGSPEEEQILLSALDFFDWCVTERKFENPGIYGRSLGSSIASFVASKRKHKFLILEAPFYDVEDLIQRRGFLFYWPFSFKNQFDTHKYLKNIKNPIYVIHGNEDWIVPIESAQRLVEKYPNKISFTEINGGGHNDLDNYQEYELFIKQILEEN